MFPNYYFTNCLFTFLSKKAKINKFHFIIFFSFTKKYVNKNITKMAFKITTKQNSAHN